jgi:urease beta subunit
VNSAHGVGAFPPTRFSEAVGSVGEERRSLPPTTSMIPGEYLLGDGDIIGNVGRSVVELEVTNTGDRPIQVGSHFHFFEVNRALRFDRQRAFGMRLNVPAGTAVRFEPGDAKRVTLVEFGGARRVYGLNGLTQGATKETALHRLAEWEARP